MNKISFQLLVVFSVGMLTTWQTSAQNSAWEAAEMHYAKAYRNLENSKYDSTIYHFKKAVALYDSTQDVQGYIYSLNALGNSYSYLFEMELARNCFQKALERSDSLFYKGLTYNNIAKVYGTEGDYFLEAMYLQRALEATIGAVGEDDGLTTTIISNIGANLHDRGKYREAIQYYERALRARKRIFKEDVHDSFAQSYWIIAVANGELGLHQKELELLNKALKIWLELDGENVEHVARIYADIGLCYGDLLYPDKKLFYLKKSLAIRRKIHKGISQNLSASLYWIGQCYHDNGEYGKALKHYKEALNAVGIEKSKTNDLSSLTINANEISAKPMLLTILKLIGKTLLASYKKNQKEEYLHAAGNIYENAVNIIYKQRGQLTTVEAKRLLSTNVRPLFEGAINVAMMQYRSTGMEKYVVRAFEYSEKSKSYILQERLNESGARKLGGIPDYLLAKENKIKLVLSDIQKRLLTAKQRNDTRATNQINKELNDKKLSYDSLIKSFENDFPDYYKLKYAAKTPSIDNIRKSMLTKDKDLLEYFVGQDHIYIFRITSNDISAKRIANNFDLAKWVRAMREGIYNYHFTEEESRSDSLYYAHLEEYKLYAQKLYQKLIAPFADSGLSPNVLIVPDGELNFVPFGALLTQVPAANRSFKEYPYLIKKHTFQFLYNTNFIYSGEDPIGEDLKIMAFAPTFDKIRSNNVSIDSTRRSGLSPLKYNSIEVQNIAEVIQADIFLGPNANRDNFVNEAGNYDIIHIASHAKADNITPERSYVAFSKGINKGKDPNLYLMDIYNMNLEAEMVVLSACETGFGKLYGSEGVASLAQGFAYAGCKSMVTTLWSVEDKATSDIISRFYYELSNGVSKDVALYQSQANYLASDIKDYQRHPYYWSGIIMIGDPKPVVKNNQNLRPWLILIGCLFVMASLIVSIRKYRLRH